MYISNAEIGYIVFKIKVKMKGKYIMNPEILDYVRDEKFMEFSKAIKTELSAKIMKHPYFASQAAKMKKYENLENLYKKAKTIK